ncbi:14706_t:CDS:10 [Funneliformis geosporum]|uniref:9838_t:CDS:1 n=1 Tax=Funneliformis geosporum TaxID=1117311 RepID=A0A9W4SFV7_9GLOM|nr:9838_t:CDS:10 [Funneliformis geosporum]CAI2171017.1 14706_t:CDS:10 [Funneliformis geosporum]
MKGVECFVCKSRKWFPDGLGGLVCQYGHQLESYTVQESEFQGGQSGVKTRSKGKKEKAAVKEERYAYHNQKDLLWIEFVAMQFILRYHVQIMIKDMGITPQLENVCKHLWIMYVNKFNGIDEIRKNRESMDIDEGEGDGPSNIQDEEDNIESLFELPQSSSDDEYDEFDDDTTTKGPNRRKDSRSRKDIKGLLQLQYLLVILHIGCLWLRLPILIGDIHRWIYDGTLPFLSARQYLPRDIKLHLGSRINKFEPRVLVLRGVLFDLETRFHDFYKVEYGISFPEINAPPIIYRYVRDLMLPVELYVISKELAQLINLNLFHEFNHNKYNNYRPSTLLLAIVIIAAKMIYGLDERRRFPGKYDQFTKHFPSFEDWIKSLSDMREAVFKKELPFDASDIKEWTNINPDQYIKYCANLLGNRNRLSGGTLRIDQIYTEIDERSKPFKTLNETIVQEIKLKEVELGLDSLTQEKKRSTPSGKLRVIEKLEDKEISKLLRLKIKKELNKVAEKVTSSKPIEEELKLLFETADFDHNEYNQSILPYQDNNNLIENDHPSTDVRKENYGNLPDPLGILRHRYSTFLFKKPENPDQKLLFGENYTAYQVPIFSQRYRYDRNVELIGDYHEDYERVLIFASDMVGETIDELQKHIMKVEVDLLLAIEKKNWNI